MKAQTLAGTPPYMAPEILDGKNYSFSADVWPAALIFLEILKGEDKLIF